MPKARRNFVSKARNPMILPKADESTQLRFLERSAETFTKHQISCWVCAAEEEMDGGTETEFAREVYRLGWRYVQSAKFRSEGPLCPECAALPDDQLGD